MAAELKVPILGGVATRACCICSVKQVTVDKYRQCSRGNAYKGPELRVLHHALPKTRPCPWFTSTLTHTHTHELNRLLQGGRDATLRVSPPECSSVINLKVYFIQKYTASSIAGGSYFPNAESAKIQWNNLTLPIPEKPGMEKEPYDATPELGRFLSSRGQKAALLMHCQWCVWRPPHRKNASERAGTTLEGWLHQWQKQVEIFQRDSGMVRKRKRWKRAHSGA